MSSIEESASPKSVDVPIPVPPSPALPGSPESGHAPSLENGDTSSGTESVGSPLSPASTFSLLEDDPDRKSPEPDEEPQFRGRRNQAVEQRPLQLVVQPAGIMVVVPPVLPEHEAGDAINAPEVVPVGPINPE